MDYIQNPRENVFSLVRPIVNLRTGQINSWFVIEIREDKLKSMLSGSNYGQDGYLLLYQPSSGTVVSNFSMHSTLLQDFQTSLALDPDQNREFIFNSDNVKYQAVYADIPYGHWKLVWMAPLSSITKGVQQSTQLTMLIAVVSLIIALIIAFPVMNSVLRPLFKLKGGIVSLGRGAYVPIQIKYSNDEIGFLIQSYNQMLGELQRMEQEVFESRVKEKERELLQLQAQINPHFLFNTLETIESYAVKNNGEAVGEMVQSVSRMMRYNVRNDGGWAPVKEEMAYIRNFLNIHHYRNGKDVMAKFDVDSAAADIPIMKLSIQPFVENAIKYGWSPSMGAEEFLLTVTVELTEGTLHIDVRDTGTGIPAHILDKITRLIHSKGEIVDPYFQKHTAFTTYTAGFCWPTETRQTLGSLPIRIREPGRQSAYPIGGHSTACLNPPKKNKVEKSPASGYLTASPWTVNPLFPCVNKSRFTLSMRIGLLMEETPICGFRNIDEHTSLLPDRDV